MNPEQIPQSKSLEVKRTAKQFANELVEKGHVREAIFSPEGLDPTPEEIELMPASVREYIPHLIAYRNKPLLIDDIEERKNNTKRNIIHDAINGYDKELAEAYKEGNKLGSSVILHTLLLIVLMAQEHTFSESIMQKIESVRMAIDGKEANPDPTFFSTDRYKYELDNSEKRNVVESLDELILAIFDELKKDIHAKAI